MEQEKKDLARVAQLFERISTLIEQARQHVRTTVNLTEVYTKFHIGQYIVEDEQQGQYRAQYGKQVLKNLSGRLTDRFGSSESPSFTLSWSHYLILMRIDNPDERSFYEIECTQQQWSVRQLSRQVGSSGVFTLSAR